ncbi:MAG TPA: Uma2 family endonuclease [Candidatus Angelobacter sp.]|nr:Uma2 family endonuclease [Candidatus Angelobacter sp.]
MGTTTKLTFEEFVQLPEEPGKRFELDEGELIVEASPTLRHNAIRDRIARTLKDFVVSHRLGNIAVHIDFRLAPNVVRRPDVAFVALKPLRRMDIDRSPLEGVPNLAVEVISPSNSAQDMLKKVHQYLAAGCQAVWVFYPTLKLVEIHDASGISEIGVPGSLQEERLFEGNLFTLPLASVFDEDLTK